MKKHLLFLAVIVAALCLLLPATAIATEGESVYEAQIGAEKYESLSDAFSQGGEITLLKDVTITTTLNVTNEVVLNLNGKTLTGAPEEAKVYSVIKNTGKLIINDNVGSGKILCDHKLTGSTGYAVNTILNSGTLIINGGTIENKSTASNQIGYAVDNNSTSYNTALVINGGNITASGSNYYDGIRLFCNNLTAENSVTVNGGNVSSIWLQNPSDGTTERNTKDVKGAVSITGGNVNALYLEPSASFSASVTGGHVGNISYFETSEGRDLTGFISGGTFGFDPTATDFLADGCIINNSTANTWVVYAEAAAKVGDVLYGSLADAIAAATDGQEVNLLKDISGSGIIIDKSILVDFCGYTYTLTEPPVGSSGTETLGFQIKTGNDVTLQNGRLTVDKNYATNYAILIQNYANLTLTDMNLDGTNLDRHTIKDYDYSYVLSNNSGIVRLDGSTHITANNDGDAYAFDVCKYSSYDAPTVTVDTTGRIIGKIEVTSGLEGNLTIENGTFSVNPSAYLAENKIATLQNGLFYVADKPEDAPDVSVDIKAEDTVKEEIQIDTNAGIATEDIAHVQQAVADAVNKEDTKQDLQNAANNLQHDSTVVGSADEAHNALSGSAGYDENVEVEVQVKPYLEVTVKKYDTESNTVKLDIKALYDVVAVQKGNGNEVTASATLKEAQPMTNVTTAITITIPLPTGFANDGDTVYIYHTKSDGTLYIHEATVSVAGGATTATFVNDQGFSSFEVKKTGASLQTLDYTNLNLGNNLDINFYIAMSKLPANTENLVAKFIRTYADGSTAQTEVPFSSWVVDGSYYRFTYAGIAAKEMCDNVTVQIFDGNTAVSVAFTESIQKYAQRLFDWDGAEAKDFKMMISLLDYGTTAQEYLNYNTINLANSIVTQTHKNKAEQAV